MPIPSHLICSESGAIDDATKFTSAFNFVEKVQMVQLQAVPGQPLLLRANPLRITAYWLKEESDAPETDFEVQIVAIFPNGPSEFELARYTFRFVGQGQRINLVGWQVTQFFGPGILRIEARIRRAGQDEWINRMSYPIILEDGVPAIAQPPPGPIPTLE